MLETLRRRFLEPVTWTKLFSSVNTKPYFLVVGFVSDARNNCGAGDYLAFKLGQDSVLVVRGEKGDLRAFYNVCGHRGSELVPMPDSTPQSSIQAHDYLSLPRLELSVKR